MTNNSPVHFGYQRELAYRLDDGYCVEGPCEGMSLERIPIRVDDDGYVVLEP